MCGGGAIMRHAGTGRGCGRHERGEASSKLKVESQKKKLNAERAENAENKDGPLRPWPTDDAGSRAEIANTLAVGATWELGWLCGRLRSSLLLANR